MRCSKCGYYSFDHLSECKKCHTDLREIRDDLGLPDLDASIPHFLEALIEGEGNEAPGVHAQASETDSPEKATAPDHAAAEVDFSTLADEVLIELTDEVLQHGTVGGGPRTAEFDTSDEAESKHSETSDKRLPLGMIGEDLDRLLRDIQAEPEAEKTSHSEAAAADAELQDILDLDIDDLELELEEIESSGAESAQKLDAESSEMLKPSTDAEEGLVLELNDEDLEGLVLDVQDETGPATKEQPQNS